MPVSRTIPLSLRSLLLLVLGGALAGAGCEPPQTEGTEARPATDTAASDTTAAPPSAGDASDASIAFRGLGQEPGWTLEVVPGQRIHFSYDYGEAEVTTPAPTPTTEAGRTIYRATTEAHDLRVVIEDEPCEDVMSGQPFPATVTVTLDGEAYRSCGEPA